MESETPDVVIDTPSEPEDLSLVALTPADLAPVQADLAGWCDRKIAAVQQELAEMEANWEIATHAGWQHASVAATLARTKKRVVYYQKIKAAVEAGYLIVPNFPIDLFAVRVKRRKQRERESSYRHSTAYRTADAELLPAGEGRYVNETLQTRDMSYTEDLPGGKTREVARYVSAGYDDFDFPILTVKPVVLEAATRAMALKLFDEIGTVQNTGGGRDPILVGRLRDPRRKDRCVTFFIAWWLNTRDL